MLGECRHRARPRGRAPPESGGLCGGAPRFAVEFFAISANDGAGGDGFAGESTMTDMLNRKIRVPSDRWKRIETAANERGISPNRMLVELALEALDRREWPRTEAEIHLLRSAMFAAQAITRDMIADGRAEEVERIRKAISIIAPDMPSGRTDADG